MNECLEAFASAAGGLEAALESPGGAFRFGVFLFGAIDGGIGQADHHAPNRPEHARAVGMAHSALILAQGDVQAVVEPAFHSPVAALEGEHPLGLELFEGEAAEQINDLARPLLFLGLRVLAFDPGLQASGQARSWKADLSGRDFQAFQGADLQTAAVALPFEGLGFGRGLRGKNAVG